MAMYLDPTSFPSPEGDFDPKFKQKAVYKWYDARYSDEALDIYSTEWRERIISWYEQAVQHTATVLSSERHLDQLEFGSLFLAHPIAAFSLWQVLQSCYGLDRVVCGMTDEVISWQNLPPFQYFRDSDIHAQWQESLRHLRERIKNRDLNSGTDSWEYKMYEILRGVEKFESSFDALKENFSVNLVDVNFASWMIDRIDNDIGKRFAMITDLLRFKEQELETIRPTDSSDNENTIPNHPKNPRSGWMKRSNEDRKAGERQKAAKPKPAHLQRQGLTKKLKSGFDVLKGSIQKPTGHIKRLNQR
ncbi:hypothetical protein B7463_g8458, partial [Scytalidium lignicola]